jgi:erythromycin esterase-like protein
MVRRLRRGYEDAPATPLLIAQVRSIARPLRNPAHFAAQQNALVLKNAEAYYRTLFRSDAESWNVRDRHMAETLQRLLDFHGPQARAIVWAHNTHIGDAHFTDMADEGTVNLGQLARERFGRDNVVLVGFGSYQGGVIAGEQWDAPMIEMRVPPARDHSWDEVLHRAGPVDKLLLLDWSLSEQWHEWRGQRAIGVVYRPHLERYGNYVPTVLPERYDAFLFLDQTEAVHPLHLPEPVETRMPETYPSGV